MKTAIIGRMWYPAARVTLTQSALIKTVSVDFNIVNQHGLTLPFTGGEGANLLAGLGLALMVAAVAAILYIKRRQNRE